MKITNIKMKNFRNYPDLDLAITSDMVILSGPNAVGKTNLLESVYFASLFKSFRDDAEFIFMKGSETAEVQIAVDREGEQHVIEVYLEKREKIYANFKIDGVKKKRKEAQGYLSVVVFEPTDVDIFTRTPETRRKYLNMVLSQKNPAYLESLANYKRVLSQKNRLLQDIRSGNAQRDALAAWNEQLVSLGVEIVMGRKRFVNFLNQNISEVYTAISKFQRTVEVIYETLEGDDAQQVRESFEQALVRLQDKEVALATSLVGPHRDDFFLQSEGLYLVPFSSRGEQRSQILALKILELEYLSRGDDKPILLLDDVLSELDESRRTFLLKYLQGKFQTFITTTHPLEMAGQHVTLSPSVQEEEA
jgi:DNA replication and repair protein RecF